MLVGGGQALVGKWGHVPDGDHGRGIDQIFADWGPPVPPPSREKTLGRMVPMFLGLMDRQSYKLDRCKLDQC